MQKVVRNKSSRTISMNHVYKIHQEREEIYVQELRGEEIDFEWHINKLKNSVIVNKGKWNKSFIRTKNWLKENHPELLI